jgi:hypothetical protein
MAWDVSSSAAVFLIASHASPRASVRYLIRSAVPEIGEHGGDRKEQVRNTKLKGTDTAEYVMRRLKRSPPVKPSYPCLAEQSVQLRALSAALPEASFVPWHCRPAAPVLNRRCLFPVRHDIDRSAECRTSRTSIGAGRRRRYGLGTKVITGLPFSRMKISTVRAGLSVRL